MEDPNNNTLELHPVLRGVIDSWTAEPPFPEYDPNTVRAVPVDRDGSGAVATYIVVFFPGSDEDIMALDAALKAAGNNAFAASVLGACPAFTLRFYHEGRGNGERVRVSAVYPSSYYDYGPDFRATAAATRSPSAIARHLASGLQGFPAEARKQIEKKRESEANEAANEATRDRLAKAFNGRKNQGDGVAASTYSGATVELGCRVGYGGTKVYEMTLRNLTVAEAIAAHNAVASMRKTGE